MAPVVTSSFNLVFTIQSYLKTNLVTMKIIKKLFILSLMSVILFSIGCNSDEEEFLEDDLIGVWEVTAASVDFSIGTMSLTEYLVSEFELSELEAQAIETAMSQGLQEGFDGAVEFRSDNTYTAEFGDDLAETGTWEFNESTQMLRLLETGEDEYTDLTVLSLSSTNLSVEFSETTTEEFRGTELEVSMLVEMSLQKQ